MVAGISQNDRAIIEAHKLGYSYDQEGNIYNPQGRKLKGVVAKKGRRYVRFTVAGVKGKPLVHRFIAYGIYGDEILNKIVRHLDDNPENNRPDNLAIGTPRDNYQDMSEESKQRMAKGTSRNLRKYKEEHYQEVMRLIREGKTHKQIRKLTGISIGVISRLRNRQAKWQQK